MQWFMAAVGISLPGRRNMAVLWLSLLGLLAACAAPSPTTQRAISACTLLTPPEAQVALGHSVTQDSGFGVCAYHATPSSDSSSPTDHFMSISVASDALDMTTDSQELEEARADKNHRSLVYVSGKAATWTTYPQNLGGGGSLIVITGGR